MSIWAPGTKRTPEGSGRRQTASRAQRDQKGAELGVARKSPSSSEHTDQSGGRGRGRVGVAHCSMCGTVLGTQGRCCVESSVPGCYSMTNRRRRVKGRRILKGDIRKGAALEITLGMQIEAGT